MVRSSRAVMTPLTAFANQREPRAEKLITPESFARVFCEDLDIPSNWVAEVAKQITEQVDEQTGVAEIAVRSEEDEVDHVEKDLRVILNVRRAEFRHRSMI